MGYLQKNNLKLSVAVIAQVSENPDDYPNNLWQRIIGVYDYSRLSFSSDFISIMSYDDPNSIGPVAGYAWLRAF
jgi:spore germination protein YaaH